MSSDLPSVWITIQVDPLETQVVVIGITQSEKDAKLAEKRATTPWVHTFRLGSDPRNVHAWLVKCGMTSSIARDCVRGIGEGLTEILNEIVVDD